MLRGHSKSDYLDLAADFMRAGAGSGRRSFQFAVAHVDIGDVARAAGVTRGALYRIWETNDDFWTDLAVYIAILDDAPWILTLVGDLDVSAEYPDGFFAEARRFLTAAEAELATDPRPLLRAGIIGYPDGSPAAAALAATELRRLAPLVSLCELALQYTGRRMRAGVTTMDFSMLVYALADGFAIAARFRDAPPPISLLGLCDTVFAHGVGEPDPDAGTANAWSDARPLDTPPEAANRPHGKRLEYLQLAAAMAMEPPVDHSGRARGPVSLDDLARFSGVSRSAVRRFWSNQTELGRDLAAHLFRKESDRLCGLIDHEAQVARAVPTTLADAAQRIGDGMYADSRAHADDLSFLAFVPQLDEPVMREHVALEHTAAVDKVSEALTELFKYTAVHARDPLTTRDFTFFLFAAHLGITRVMRTNPDVVGARAFGVLTREVLLQLTHSESTPDWRGLPPWVPDLSLPTAVGEG